MHTLLNINQLDERMKRLRLTPVGLCELAGINYATFYRARKQPGSISMRNMQALTDALIEFELGERFYLLSLHPLTEGDL